VAASQSGRGANLRGRERERRRQEFLSAAWEIATSEGLDALTMQRVSNIVGSAEGTIYNYFATKELLLAEMQQSSLVILAGSVLEAMQALQAGAPDDVDPRVRALAAVVLGARVWVDAEALHPQEVELTRRVFTHSGQVFAEDAAEAVGAAARPLIDYACGLFDQAVQAGALAPGDGLERAVAVLAGTTGVLIAGDLARWDARLADVRAFAHRHVSDLLVAWGADAEVLSEAERIVEALPAPQRAQS